MNDICPDRKYAAMLLAATVLAGFLRLWGVGGQPALSDEIGAAVSAVNYMENGSFGPTMWYHPNLRNIVLYLAGQAFGYGPYALRGASLLAGILSVPLLGLLSYALTRNRGASLLAAFLLAVEQVHITFSRQAIQETWTAFFFLAGTLLAVLFCRKGNTRLIMLSGIAFGLGISSKLHALFPLLVCLAAGLTGALKERSAWKAMTVVSCLVFLPLLIYLLTYIPWFGRGYDLFDWLRMQQAVFEKMATHTGNPMDQVIDTQPWQWFLRPMGYANFVFSEGTPHVTIAYSNPLVWLLVLPASVFLLWRSRAAFRGASISAGAVPAPRDQGLAGLPWLLSLFAASYLPLAVSPRPIWLLSSLAVIPFAFLLVSLALCLWAGTARQGRKALAAYLILVSVASLAIYPMARGEAKHYSYLRPVAERFRPPFERAGTTP